MSLAPKIIALAKTGALYDAIAAETGASRGNVAATIRRARLRGENIPYRAKPRAKINAHLSLRKVAEICVRARNGQKVKDIANAMKLPVSTVGNRMAMLRAEGRLEYRYEGAR